MAQKREQVVERGDVPHSEMPVYLDSLLTPPEPEGKCRFKVIAERGEIYDRRCETCTGYVNQCPQDIPNPPGSSAESAETRMNYSGHAKPFDSSAPGFL